VPLESLTIEPRYEALVAALEGFEFKSLTEEVRKEAAAIAQRLRQASQPRAEQGDLFL
jgi:ribosomal protein L12E/L44/L45/RPP1/RPP2